MAQELRPFAEASDSQVARPLRKTHVFRQAQKKLRRANTKTGRRLIEWTKSEFDLLGTAPDEEIAHKLGRTLVAVRFQRNKLHIPKFDPKCRPWREDEIELLKNFSQEEVAAKTRRTLEAVKLKRVKLGLPVVESDFRYWTAEEDALLGVKRDEEVAQISGRTVD